MTHRRDFQGHNGRRVYNHELRDDLEKAHRTEQYAEIRNRREYNANTHRHFTVCHVAEFHSHQGDWFLIQQHHPNQCETKAFRILERPLV